MNRVVRVHTLSPTTEDELSRRVNVLLNEIPAGGNVDILLSPIHSLSSRKVELANPQLQIGETTASAK